jgi:hypothetical protein
VTIDLVQLAVTHGLDVVIGGAVVGGAVGMQAIRREIKYNTIRIVSMVYALDKESKNGFMKSYMFKKSELLEEHGFKHNKGVSD